MPEILLDHIGQTVTLTKAEKELCRSLFVPRKLRRKQVLQLQGEPFQHLAFVEKGMLRAYFTDKKKNEHIIQFAPEQNWISDNFNFHMEASFPYTIDAIENSEVTLVNKTAYNQLLTQIPKLEKYFRLVMQNRLIALHTRVVNYLTHQAEDKYKMFLNVYPDIVKRAPQHMIASYLGIKPETLSRNRKQMATRKTSREKPESNAE